MSRWQPLRRVIAAAVVVGSLASVSGCSGVTLAGKNGLSEPERTLLLADPSTPGTTVGSTAVNEFVADVSRVSHGQLRIGLRTQARDTDEETRVIRDVATGRVDLGWAEAHTFDALGAASLDPLFVPLLIDSYPLEAAVLRRYSNHLLADVRRATGVTPLALFASGLRFPASTDHPIVTAADWSGRAFLTTASGEEQAGVRALGAFPVVDARDRLTLTQSGVIDSAESTWRSYPDSIGILPFVAPNVRLWPRAVVLMASPRTIGDLDGEQRGWLKSAAAEAADWALQHAGDADVPDLHDACAAGSKAELASSQELAAMRLAGLRGFERQPRPGWMAGMLHEMEVLRDEPGYEPAVTVPDGCAFAQADARARSVGKRDPLTGPGSMGTFPVGTYRYVLTKEGILRAANGGAEGAYTDENAGVWSWIIGDGRWSLVMTPTGSSFPAVPCGGWISVSADVATFTRTVNGLPGGDCVPLVWSARFHVQDDGLHWTHTDVQDFSWVFQPEPWHKIR
jgi:TRAP-type C4-dicarboxylate transport system substrate-binding protein